MGVLCLVLLMWKLPGETLCSVTDKHNCSFFFLQNWNREQSFRLVDELGG